MQRSSEVRDSLSQAADLLAAKLNLACKHIDLLENTNAQMKEVNAALERRLATSEALIKELRAQQGEDPSVALKDIHEYIQKVRDAHDRKKRRNNRTIVASDPVASGGGAAE